MKESVKKDILWMIKNRHNFTFTGSAGRVIEFDKNASSGLKCFHVLESKGILLPTKHPNILENLLKVKASINFQIKEWAQDRASGLLPRVEFNKIIKEFNLPDWVVLAVENQKVKFYS